MEVPSHHVKQEVCTTRPPYREGRNPKAVKVYTVNNESVYIIIQGVPSVGAGGELNKLCSSYGPLEDFRPLDEYPCEDQYTEVYLVKYKKIQSSRFAKRKLDEYSFFGGNLHVCYAPEYESLQETRDKLRDRRQVVAKKIRQHTSGRAHHQHHRQPDASSAESNVGVLQQHRQPAESIVGVTPLRVPPLPAGEPTQHTDQQSISQQAEFTEFSTNSSQVSQYQGSVESSILRPSTHSHKSSQVQSECNDHIDHDVFQLPLPPKPLKTSQWLQSGKKDWRQYEYYRVPTAHATLPEGYDGRLNIPEFKTVTDSSTSTASKPDANNDQNALNTQASQVVIKNYKPTKPALKFVPRQALKVPTETTASEQQGTAVRESPSAGVSQDDNLRKNAFRLGKIQGPEEMPGRKRALPTAAQQSVNDTISSIRSKISKIIGEKVGKKS